MAELEHFRRRGQQRPVSHAFSKVTLPRPPRIKAELVSQFISEFHTDNGELEKAGDFKAGARLVYALSFDPRTAARHMVEKWNGERAPGLDLKGKISGPRNLINSLYSAALRYRQKTGKTDSPVMPALWGAAIAFYETGDSKHLKLALKALKHFPDLPQNVRDEIPHGFLEKAKSLGYRF